MTMTRIDGSMAPNRCRRAAAVLFGVAVGCVGLPSATLAIETAAREAILVDATTGAVLLEKNPDKRIPPASMSKIMTAHLVFDRLKKGQIKLEDTLAVSENAWRAGGAASGGSTMFLALDARPTVGDLLRGVIVQSGNDASIVLAEGLAGSEQAFAEEATRVARQIGMQNSTFRNATGLPDPEHQMTARDLATLAKHTIADFPEYYPIYAEKGFVYHGIKQGNRNPLLYKNIGADGLKTGHTQEAGYCLTASAAQDDRRLILVVTGLSSMKERSDETARLLDYGFREFNNYALAKKDEPLAAAEVWLGEQETVPLVAEGDGAVITLPRKARPDMKVAVVYDGPLPAPITKGQRLGTLQVTASGVEQIDIPLVAAANVERLGLFGRLVATLNHMVRGILG